MSNNILGLGNLTKPIEKLIEVVSQGIGTLYRPIAIRNEAKAQADAKITLAEAETKIKELGLDRIFYREQQRMHNIDNVVEYAINKLGNEDVSNENIDKDWSMRFFNIVEDISTEEMQAIWGKILAEEIKRPKSHSLRLLEVLKNMTRVEAEIFVKLCQYKIKVGREIFILRDFDYLESVGIYFKDLILMKELNLINSDNNLTYTYGVNATDRIKTSLGIIAEKTAILFEQKPHSPKIEIPVVAFTSIGKELSNIVSCEEIEIDDYIKKVANAIKTDGNIRVYYTKDFKLDDDELHCNDMIEI